MVIVERRKLAEKIYRVKNKLSLLIIWIVIKRNVRVFFFFFFF